MDYKNVDKSQFQYGKLKKYEKNYFCHVVYEDLEPLCVQTPTLTVATSGVTKRKGRAFVDLEIPQESKSFGKFIKDIDGECLKKAHENCLKWFQKEIAMEDIKSAYQSIIAYDSPPTLHLVLTNVDEIYNHRGESIPSSRVKAGAQVRGEMEFIGIWVTSNWIGGFWELRNLQLMAPKGDSKPESEDDEISSFKQKYKEIYPDSEQEDEQPPKGMTSASKKKKSSTPKKASARSNKKSSRKYSSDEESDAYYSDDYSDDYSDYYSDEEPEPKKKKTSRKYSSDEESEDDYYSEYEEPEPKKKKTSRKYSSDEESDEDKDYYEDDYYTDSEDDQDYYRKRERYSDSEDSKASYYTDEEEEDPIDFDKLVYDPDQKGTDQKSEDSDEEQIKDKKVVDKDTKKVNL